ncbi:MAG: hypothetical protein O7D30_08085, partial [Rickettsia endosymbiont of Ixodes persulcatus]|nr:hypothetical protein [Rickettsia endosymbiont of Ixodes persulcatus]
CVDRVALSCIVLHGFSPLARRKGRHSNNSTQTVFMKSNEVKRNCVNESLTLMTYETRCSFFFNFLLRLLLRGVKNERVFHRSLMSEIRSKRYLRKVQKLLHRSFK